MVASVDYRNQQTVRKRHKPRSLKKCRAALPASLVLAQRLCHEKDGDKQEKQAISVDIAARNTFKKVPIGILGDVDNQQKARTRHEVVSTLGSFSFAIVARRTQLTPRNTAEAYRPASVVQS